MRKIAILLVTMPFAFHGFTQTTNYKKETVGGYRGGIIKDIQTLDRSLNFVVIGDWGRHGEYYQKEVADKLADAIVGVDASFVISTGDNIYPSGVAANSIQVGNLLLKMFIRDMRLILTGTWRLGIMTTEPIRMLRSLTVK